MAYNKYDYEKPGASYMDGIPVKISEKYKPPKKIILPGAILNKLNTEMVLPEYDFILERSIMDKMSQWRQLRKEQREARRERIEAEKQTRTSVETTTNEKLSPPEPTVNSQTNPYPILTPVPINASTLSQSTNCCRSFNISDFEQDTSSPFDNMELKTINDLEELAHVLQPTVVISDKNQYSLDNKKYPPPRLNGYNAQCSFNNFNTHSNSYSQMTEYPVWHKKPEQLSSQSYVVQRLDLGGPNSKSVPDIVQQLEMELKDIRVAESRRREQPVRPASIGPTELSRKPISQEYCSGTHASPICMSTLPNPYEQLKPSWKLLVDQLAEMGFPLPRVARAVELFGDDETRIVEFLIQVQTLEDMSYPGDRAEKALIANNYKQPETLEYLKTVGQLLNLGFQEDKVEQALVECGSDRDKALDLLVS